MDNPNPIDDDGNLLPPLPPRRRTTADRQADFRRSMKAKGLSQVTVWVYDEQVPELLDLIATLRENRQLTAGPARDSVTRKLVSTKG